MQVQLVTADYFDIIRPKCTYDPSLSQPEELASRIDRFVKGALANGHEGMVLRL